MDFKQILNLRETLECLDFGVEKYGLETHILMPFILKLKILEVMIQCPHLKKW